MKGILKLYKASLCLLLVMSIIVPVVSHAHEVYVLDTSEINFALHSPMPDFLSTIQSHMVDFLTWGSITIIVIILIFLISVVRPLERAINPWLQKLKIAAPYIAQITLGISLIASGWYQAMFGVELPLYSLFSGYAHIISIILILLGSLLVAGVFPRITSALALGIFGILVVRYNIYMLNYATYAGEALTIVLFGGAYQMIGSKGLGNWLAAVEKKITPKLREYKFFIIRIVFGISLIYASLYAKLIHGNLALETVTKYHLTQYFHFDPIFLVLGAMMVEILLGLFFMVGFEIRFASLFFLVFLVLSLSFFGEVIWPHFVLIGTSLAMFCHGYDKHTLAIFLQKKKRYEPIL